MQYCWTRAWRPNWKPTCPEDRYQAWNPVLPSNYFGHWKIHSETYNVTNNSNKQVANFDGRENSCNLLSHSHNRERIDRSLIESSKKWTRAVSAILRADLVVSVFQKGHFRLALAKRTTDFWYHGVVRVGGIWIRGYWYSLPTGASEICQMGTEMSWTASKVRRVTR